MHNDVAWLAHIIVHPEFRNKGLGKLITQTLVDRAKTENCSTVYLIATELGAPVYEEVGFVTEAEYLGFKDGNIEQGTGHSANVVLLEEKHMQQVYDMDGTVTGENRTFRLESNLAGAFVYEVNDKVEGYYLPEFGEGLVVAINASAGISLMKVRLQKSNNVRFPSSNQPLLRFLRQNNYIQYLGQKRMRLGKERLWQPANLYSRTGGQVG